MNHEFNVKVMNDALVNAAYSKDESVQNGAVLIGANGLEIGAGYNRLPLYVHNNPERWERPQKYMWVEHAERSSIYNAAWDGNSTHGATLYCPWAACADCARAIIESGVRELVRLPMTEADGWTESIQIGDQMMKEAFVKIIEIPIEDVTIPQGLRLGQWRS